MAGKDFFKNVNIAITTIGAIPVIIAAFAFIKIEILSITEVVLFLF